LDVVVLHLPFNALFVAEAHEAIEVGEKEEKGVQRDEEQQVEPIVYKIHLLVTHEVVVLIIRFLFALREGEETGDPVFEGDEVERERDVDN